MLPREKTQARYQIHSKRDPRFYFFKLEKMDKDDDVNVLSLFDGMSCGMIALERAGIKVNKYFACEIDKYATQVSEKNYPNIIRLGDVNNWREWDLLEIDLIIGGSPCQGFSFAGKQLAFDDPRSKLFFTMVDIINHYKPKYFLLENVKMKKEYQDVITEYMGVQPIEINSALVSAQNRRRLYWTNITGIEQPQDKGIMLKDILEDEVDEKYFMTIEQFERLGFESLQRLYFEKAPALSTMQGGHRQPKILCNLYNKRIMIEKSGTLGTGGGFTNKQGYQVIEGKHKIRKLTPIECERLQTVPDNYTEGVSNSQRYKMLGNGRTVDVIAHIFSYLK